MARPALNSITVSGFKSIGSEQKIEIRPLTILAGANNSGKSSIMQPLLLLKQTLLAPVDPGGLRLQGPFLRLAPGELWHYDRWAGRVFGMDLSFEFDRDCKARLKFGVVGPRIDVVTSSFASGSHLVEYGSSESDGVTLHRFLPRNGPRHSTAPDSTAAFETILQWMIHVPAIRILEGVETPSGLPESIEAPFGKYVAQIIRHWDEIGEDSTAFKALQDAVSFLGVSVRAQPWFDGLEVEVGMFPPGIDNPGFIRPSNAGFGVSQAIPVVVALLYAEPGDLVYIEEPEAHLHPKAQIALARQIARAARRGVRVVMETHSSLMLQEIQTLVAQGDLPADIAKLHWFQRDSESFETRVQSADLDDEGTFGDWPADFDVINFDSEKAFLDASFARGRR